MQAGREESQRRVFLTLGLHEFAGFKVTVARRVPVYAFLDASVPFLILLPNFPARVLAAGPRLQVLHAVLRGAGVAHLDRVEVPDLLSELRGKPALVAFAGDERPLDRVREHRHEEHVR